MPPVFWRLIFSVGSTDNNHLTLLINSGSFSNYFNLNLGILQVLKKAFESGTSIFYVGAGIDGSFGNAEGEITQKFYIVFDQNNQFADLGMRGSASGNISGAIGAEFTYDIAMNAGFNAQSEVKSEWIETYEKALGFVVKQ